MSNVDELSNQMEYDGELVLARAELRNGVNFLFSKSVSRLSTGRVCALQFSLPAGCALLPGLNKKYPIKLSGDSQLTLQ
jgi:hypothetical protein